MKEQLEAFWAVLREQKVGDVVDKAKSYAENVRAGADPIEALHGHLCGPDCWHWPDISAERKALLRKAWWNQKKASP